MRPSSHDQLIKVLRRSSFNINPPLPRLFNFRNVCDAGIESEMWRELKVFNVRLNVLLYLFC